MSKKLHAKYNKTLHTPASFDGTRREIYQLKYAKNSRLPISRLPAEVLSAVFLYVVEAGLQTDDASFVPGTFNFLRVCRWWNDVAVGFPRLWVWWIPGAIRAWPLFNIRSKDAPLFLTCRSHIPTPAQDILMDPAISGRVHRFDFRGTHQQLADFLGIFDSSPSSNVSSIRLQIQFDQRGHNEPPERVARFLSSPFPKLSVIDIKNFLPDPISPIFATSNLTSLKLDFYAGNGRRYTLSQFSQILQRHPNLRELDLQNGGIPLLEPSESSTPFVLPQLAYLRLHGMKPAIMEFIDFIGMSSPLHNVAIYFQELYNLTVPVFTDTVKKVLAAYYGCPGMDCPRKVNRLLISSTFLKNDLIFDAGSHSTFGAPCPTSNLKLQFSGLSGMGDDSQLLEKAFPLFPLEHVHEFTAEALDLVADDWRRMLREMKQLSCLRLDDLDIGPVLDALGFDNQDKSSRPPAPKLQSLTLSNLDILLGRDEELPKILMWRREHNVGLSSLLVRSCRVHSDSDEIRLKELVKEVTWEDTRVMGWCYDGSESEESEETDSDVDVHLDHWRKAIIRRRVRRVMNAQSDSVVLW